MLKGWKTIIVAALVALAGVAESVDWVNLLGEETGGIALTVVGVVMAALRWITNSPVGSKE